MLSVLFFFGFLALFLFGMTLLRIGMFQLSGDRLQQWISPFISHPAKGMIASIVVTMILQSSSAVMVLTIGLVSARIITFPQTIGIILGTNIGTTFTAEFMTFPIDQYILPISIFGAVCILLPTHWIRSSGFILLGIGALFTGLQGFKTLAKPLTEVSFVQTLLHQMDNSILLASLVGIVITALIHSSSATTGIGMGFVAAGVLSMPAAIAVILGANIGTCVTGYMASIGSGKEARLTAYAHIWLNVVGVAIFLPFVYWIDVWTSGFASSPAVQLAHTSVLFNVATALLVFPFAKQFGKLIVMVHGKR
ncbi:Na/Pi symporter [Bacillus fonticola]|uniref:Na/Pi symporter n=1 Tax=Bacillus fonticola TaxID=2728853 RepID=UPI001473BBD0|nr:Na/Pi symporter [Bacillus fonticola]